MKIIPFNYTIKDAGQGWNKGVVHLAFENISDRLLPRTYILISATDGPTTSPSVSTLSRDATVYFFQASLETEEGKTYSASPVPIHIADDLSHIDVGILPPGIPTRVPLGLEWFEYEEYVITFRFAQAAHPTRVVLRGLAGSPTVYLDLRNVPERVPDADLARYEIRPIADLAGTIIKDSSCCDGIVATFGKGHCDEREREVALPIEVRNTNELDDSRTDVFIEILLYEPHSHTLLLRERAIELRAGPGQTREYPFSVGWTRTVLAEPPSYVFKIERPDNTVTAYKLDCP